MKNLLFTIAILNSCILYAQVNTFNISGSLSPAYSATLSETDPNPVLTFTLSAQNPNLLFAGPSSGMTALAPTFRSLVIADVPFAINTTENQTASGIKTFTDDLKATQNFRLGSNGSNIQYRDTILLHQGGGNDESLFLGKLSGGGSTGNTGGHGNVGMGFSALSSLSSTYGIGGHNTAIGYLCMQNATSAKRNTFVGSTAAQNLTVSTDADPDALENTGMGWQVMVSATTAGYNSVFGSKAGFNITTANSNTLFGVSSGGTITTGSSNIMIGYQSGVGTGGTTTGYNNILIGNNIVASGSSAHDETNIGNFLYHTLTGTGFGDQSPDDFFTIGTNSQVQFSNSGSMLTSANIILSKTGTGVLICGSTTQSYRTTNSGSNINFQAAFDVDNSASSAGAKAYGFDPTNGFVFTHANGNRRIAGAAITITNLDNTSGSEDADLSFYTQSNGTAITERLRITNQGGIVINATNTSSGTTGAQTINKPSGTVNFAAGATSLVVTNSLVTTNSLVFATIRTNDATAIIKNVVSTSGSFTINLNASATVETSVGFFVVN